MVIVKLMGGLGNQMFQYALGRSLALARSVPLKMDLSWFNQQASRFYRLHHFNVSADIATEEDVTGLLGGPDQVSKIARLFWRVKPYYRRPWVRQRYPGFDPNILQAPDRVYLEGYWQSEKYFTEIEMIVRQELTVRHLPDPVNQAMANRINEVESVSLHVRRGDYVSNPVTYQYHGVCPPEYYQAAMKAVTKVVKQPHIFIFSDDIGWVQENLDQDFPMTYVAHNGPDKDYEDLRLMSQCQHHIIANSTFSWWGAWLCVNPSKSIVAPERWFASADRHTPDLLPDSWHRI